MNHKALKRYREEAGLTQEQLAREADISASMIQKLERGLTDASTSTVNALVSVLAHFLPISDNKILTVLMGREREEAHA